MDCTGPAEAVNSMTQDVFNWMARSVNKDFEHLGYPSILTKKGSRDFVSLCALMQNCSALLAVAKARGGQQHEKGTTTAGLELAPAAAGAKQRSHSSSGKKRGGGCGGGGGGGGLFSSKAFKQMQQQSAESQARLAADVSRAMNFDAEFASVFEGIAETVKRDTEQVIEATRCVAEAPPTPAVSVVDANDNHQQQQQQQHEQLMMFFASRWVQFKEAVTRRLLDAEQLAVEVQSLRTSGRGLCGYQQQYQHQHHQPALLRSKSVTGDTAFTGQLNLLTQQNQHQNQQQHQRRRRSLSRHASAAATMSQQLDTPPTVSVTKVPALEAEIRRLKLELGRREARHKDELNRQAKDRERLSREFRLAQRRIPGPRWPLVGGAQQQNQHQQQQQQQHQQASEAGDSQQQQHQHQHQHQQGQALTDICQTLDRLADSLGQMMPTLRTPGASNKHKQQEEVQIYVDSICSAALSRIQGLQADCHTSRRRQADLEVLISILKARFDFTNDQLSDVAKFESAVNDIAKRLPVAGAAGCGGCGVGDSCPSLPQPSPLPPPQQQQKQPRSTSGGGGGGGGDEHRDSLVSRLTSRLRERQRIV